MKVLDAHLHLWKRTARRYRWLDRPPLSAIARDYRPVDARDALADTPVESVVLVQAENSTDDTDDMLAAATEWPAVRGVVSWFPLENPDALDRELGRLAGNPLVVGCRHLNHDEADPGWLARPAVHAGLRKIAARGLTFDVVAVTQRHLRDSRDLAARHPNLTVVVDHLGSPPLDTLAWEPWADALTRLSSQPNAVVKISGLATLGPHNFQAQLIKPYIEHARQQFGADRLMYGGDWPVSTLARPYGQTWEVINEAVGDWSVGERARLFTDTATDVYRLRR